MAGALMRLVAYGAQDVYLTGNPQITFFKVVYRRHTNFACEAIEQVFNGTPATGGKAVVPITRNGDLITKMWLHTTATASGTSDANIGYTLINSVELQIGGTKIDKIYGKWMYIWNELSSDSNGDTAHDTIVGASAVTDTTTELFIPLTFFCCRNDGLALPLIALQYHDVRLEFEFGSPSNVAISNTSLLVNYVFLDSEERKRFATASHEYLIEQLQFTGAETVTAAASNKTRLNFNHPVKELVWVTSASGAAVDTYVPITNALLQLNGHDRFSVQSGRFFDSVQPHTHHTSSKTGINVYSFALNPEEHQPSGTCNFSRIDNATLTVTTKATAVEMYVYATSYNVLRIMSGMGGLAYSN